MADYKTTDETRALLGVDVLEQEVEALQTASALGYPVYDSTAEGLAATALGGGFSVRSGGDLVLYRDAGGSAVEVARLPLADRVAALEASGATGMIPKTAVACATTGNITLSGEQTIDGVTTAGSRVLVKNQTVSAENGIYVSAGGAWTRAADMNAADEFAKASAYVSNGTVNAGRTYYQANTITTLGTDAVAWLLAQDQSGLSGDVAKLRTLASGTIDKYQTIDALAAATWSENTLLLTTGGTSGISNYRTSSYIDVLPGDMLELTCGPNSTYPNVVGYDAAQGFKEILHTGGVATDANTGARGRAYIPIPFGIYKIRLGTATSTPVTLARRITQTAYHYDRNIAPALKSSSESNLLGVKYYPSTDGAPALATGTSTKGTGYIPVKVGDTITWHLRSQSTIYGIALYDASKTFLRFLVGNDAVYGTEKSYTLNAVDDANVAYLMGGVFDNQGTLARAYLYVSSQNSLPRKIDEAKAFAEARSLRRTKPNITFAGANSLTITDLGETLRVVTNTTPNYLALTRKEPAVEGYTSGFYALKIKVTALPGGETSAKFTWVINPNTTPSNDPTDVALNETVTLYGGFGSEYTYLSCDKVGVTYEVLESAVVEMAPDIFSELKPIQIAPVIEHPRFFDQRHSVSERAFRAFRADTLNTRFYGKKGAYFGNSLQYMMWPYLEQYMGLTMTRIAPNGSDAQSCLTDANLALVPTDASLVTISFGSGNNVPDAGYRAAPSIDSRDRATSEGAINFAIDWLTANRPEAFIMLISPMYCGEPGRDNQKWYDAQKALAEYWHLPFADVWMNSDVSARNWSLYSYDNIHLTPEGIARQGGVVAGKIRSLSW